MQVRRPDCKHYDHTTRACNNENMPDEAFPKLLFLFLDRTCHIAAGRIMHCELAERLGPRPVKPPPPPTKKLGELLVKHKIIQNGAITDPENYDGCATSEATERVEREWTSPNNYDHSPELNAIVVGLFEKPVVPSAKENEDSVRLQFWGFEIVLLDDGRWFMNDTSGG